MCKKKVYSISIVFVLSLVVPAFSQVTLLNGDFEAQTLADGAWAEGAATNWTTVNSAGAQNLSSGALTPPAHDGQNVCFLNQNGQIYQGLQEQGNPILVEANKSYKISVWVGRRGGTEGTYGGILEIFLQESGALTRITTATYDLQNPNQPRNSWTNQTFYLTTGVNPPGLGYQLQLGFANVSTRAPANQFWFAQVILDSVSIESIDPIAINPSPANNSLAEGTTVTLQWQSGPFATENDIFLADNLDDVNAATSSSPMGPGEVYKARQDANSYTVTDLTPGATYYWRVDGVSGTDVWRGDIWTFTVPQPTAHDPIPADGAKFVDADVMLRWTAGANALHHHVYFGNNRNEVLNGTGRTDKGIVDVNTFSPGQLAFETTYYWRINEDDGKEIHEGDIWTFTTTPQITVTDPNFVAWWPLDEGEGRDVFDWSGRGNHAKIIGSPQWVVGQIDIALSFSGGYDEYVDCGNAASLNITNAITLSAWVNTNDAGNSEDNPYVTKGNNSYALRHGAGNSIGFYIYDSTSPFSATYAVNSGFNGVWHHLAGTYDGNNLNLYIDGEPMATTAHVGTIDISAFNVNIGSDAAQTWMWYNGLIDDVRIYSRGLSQQEIQQIIVTKSEFATRPSPASGSRPDIEHLTPLSWMPGENAAQHDVYFGTDANAVGSADISDTTDIYRGRQDPNTYTPPEELIPGQTYYWRVDEFNADATISRGRIWSFTVADYLIVDDFEDYNDFSPDRIFDTWADGWNVTTNGSQVGYGTAPFAERAIVNSGLQSMPFFYNNTGSAVYSEAVRSFDAPLNDWTREGARTLTLFFRGYPAEFVEDPAGTYAMAAGGEDIWGQADQFRYAYKRLSGNGSITARVVSIENTDEWAKAGVMIRDTLDDYSVNALMCATPSNRRSFQNRQIIAETSYQASSNIDAITLPLLWVRVVRQGNNFTGYYSENGINWIQQPDDENTGDDASPNPQTIVMSQNVYIGLAYTSHNANAMGTAVFSDVTTTGTVTGDDWQVEAIGADMPSNEAQPLYVVVRGGGVEKVVEHPDNPNAVLEYTWQQWDIPLSVLSDAGVTLSTIQDITIGVGSQNGGQGGTGRLYFDDIRLYLAEE